MKDSEVQDLLTKELNETSHELWVVHRRNAWLVLGNIATGLLAVGVVGSVFVSDACRIEANSDVRDEAARHIQTAQQRVHEAEQRELEAYRRCGEPEQ